MRLACQHTSSSPRPPSGRPGKEIPPFSETSFFGHDLTSFCPKSSWCAFHRATYRDVGVFQSTMADHYIHKTHYYTVQCDTTKRSVWCIAIRCVRSCQREPVRKQMRLPPLIFLVDISCPYIKNIDCRQTPRSYLFFLQYEFQLWNKNIHRSSTLYLQPRWRYWSIPKCKLFYDSLATGNHVQLTLVVRTTIAGGMSSRHQALRSYLAGPTSKPQTA